MLHTKFRENLPAYSGEEGFFKGLTIYGHGGHLGHVTSILSKIFISIYLKAYIQIWFKMTLWFLRKACFNVHT